MPLEFSAKDSHFTNHNQTAAIAAISIPYLLEGTILSFITSREVREVRKEFMLLSLLGDLEFWRLGDFF